MKKYFLICTVILLPFFISCNKNDIESIEISNEEFEQAKAIIEGLGFDMSEITELDEFYVVEGDILFEKSNMHLYQGVTTKQAVTNRIVNPYNKKEFTVGVRQGVAPVWEAAVRNAANNWSNIYSRLSLRYVGYNSADIMIETRDWGQNSAGSSGFPDPAGNPFNNVILSTWYNNSTDAQRTSIVTHELGHCLGFRHTDCWQYENSGSFGMRLVTGTPYSDPASIMNRGKSDAVGNLLVANWSGFSTYDVSAIQRLWPQITIKIEGLLSNPGSNYPEFEARVSNGAGKITWVVYGGTITSTHSLDYFSKIKLQFDPGSTSCFVQVSVIDQISGRQAAASVMVHKQY